MSKASSTQSEKEISWEQFGQQFKPIKNHVTSRQEFNGWLFETYDDDLAHVMKVNQATPDRVWTIIDSDGVIVIGSGFSFVNRIGYVITEIECPANVMITVVDEEDREWAQYEQDETSDMDDGDQVEENTNGHL